MTGSILAATSHATAKRRGLLADTADQASRVAAAKEANRLRELQLRQLRRNQIKERVRLALKGLARLSQYGLSQEFQSLITAQKRPLRLWGGVERSCAGGDMSDIVWMYFNYIDLTATSIELRNDVETSADFGSNFRPHPAVERDYLSFPYADGRFYLRAKAMMRIARPEAFDLQGAQCHEDIGDWNERYSVHVLFEILVRCADARKFGRLVRTAMQ